MAFAALAGDSALPELTTVVDGVVVGGVVLVVVAVVAGVDGAACATLDSCAELRPRLARTSTLGCRRPMARWSW
ncbi:MAG: hypothetical protein ACR2ND_15460 [Solirubrobacteraceae bacterium]